MESSGNVISVFVIIVACVIIAHVLFRWFFVFTTPLFRNKAMRRVINLLSFRKRWATRKGEKMDRIRMSDIDKTMRIEHRVFILILLFFSITITFLCLTIITYPTDIPKKVCFVAACFVGAMGALCAAKYEKKNPVLPVRFGHGEWVERDLRLETESFIAIVELTFSLFSCSLFLFMGMVMIGDSLFDPSYIRWGGVIIGFMIALTALLAKLSCFVKYLTLRDIRKRVMQGEKTLKDLDLP